MAIRTNGIAMLHRPIRAYQIQFLLKASILIPDILHKINNGMLAKITLTRASVIGSYEYVAIFILKKEEPQITASKINKDKSKVFASLITSLKCGYVINA